MELASAELAGRLSEMGYPECSSRAIVVGRASRADMPRRPSRYIEPCISTLTSTGHSGSMRAILSFLGVVLIHKRFDASPDYWPKVGRLRLARRAVSSRHKTKRMRAASVAIAVISINGEALP